MLLVHFAYLEFIVLLNNLLLQFTCKVHGPLKHVCDGLQILVKFYVFSNLGLQRVYDQLIRRLLLKLKSKNFLKDLAQILGDHLEDFFRILDGQSLAQKVFELIVLVLKLLVKIAPGKVVFVQEVYHDVEATLNVITS